MLIPLGKGKFANLFEGSWYCGYAQMNKTKVVNGRKVTTVHSLHLFVANRTGIVAEEVDHKNRDRLDCRRENLRAATKSLNTKGETGRETPRKLRHAGAS